METRITINGRQYTSVDEMPPDVRRQYERVMQAVDRNANGIPDALEGSPDSRATDPNTVVVTTRSSRLMFNNREYRNLDDLPPEFRELVRSQSRLPQPADSRTPHEGRSGFTLHVTWTNVLALVCALAMTGLILWLIR